MREDKMKDTARVLRNVRPSPGPWTVDFNGGSIQPSIRDANGRIIAKAIYKSAATCADFALMSCAGNVFIFLNQLYKVIPDDVYIPSEDAGKYSAKEWIERFNGYMNHLLNEGVKAYAEN